MLIDNVKIRITAGNGGKGMVTFRKELMALGPTGGNGGRGGNVYLQGISNLNALSKFRFKKEFKAGNGKDGGPQLQDGANGEDLVLKVPTGTVAVNLDKNEKYEINKINEKKLVAQGGRGGKGNFYFRSSTNTSPKEFEYGKTGQSFNFDIELKLIADVGFIGLPNVGKSSLINELTNAKTKVANYPFTTLEPNLGVYFDLIIADIPGLIENASQGKGLGFRFLKHIEHTKILFHFISAESLNPIKDYEIVNGELKKYNQELATKKEYLFLTKKDLISQELIDKIIKDFKKIIAISVFDEQSIKQVEKILNNIISEKKYEKQ